MKKGRAIDRPRELPSEPAETRGALNICLHARKHENIGDDAVRIRPAQLTYSRVSVTIHETSSRMWLRILLFKFNKNFLHVSGVPHFRPKIAKINFFHRTPIKRYVYILPRQTSEETQKALLTNANPDSGWQLTCKCGGALDQHNDSHFERSS